MSNEEEILRQYVDLSQLDEKLKRHFLTDDQVSVLIHNPNK